MFGPSRHPLPATTPAAAPATSAAQQPAVVPIASSAALDAFLAGNAAAVVMFKSPTCGPCRAIAPAYEGIAAEKRDYYVVGMDCAAQLGGALGAGVVDTAQARDVAARYSVSAVPTFVFFHKGEKVLPWW